MRFVRMVFSFVLFGVLFLVVFWVSRENLREPVTKEDYRENPSVLVQNSGTIADTVKDRGESSIPSSTSDQATGSGVTLHLPNDVQHIETKFVVQEVPFVAQAPFGDWGDPRQQDGCEEISALMAMAWAKGESLSRRQALERLFAISAYEETTYGSYHDTSAKDTVQRIFQEYLEYLNVEVIERVTVEAIKRELMLGNLVITPMDGQLLNNPYYSPPGPERHMVVVIGYDPASDEFITNDPGTRRGEGYRYDASDFVRAIRDYPTGNQIPISSSSRSAMIVVRK